MSRPKNEKPSLAVPIVIQNTNAAHTKRSIKVMVSPASSWNFIELAPGERQFFLMTGDCEDILDITVEGDMITLWQDHGNDLNVIPIRFNDTIRR
jgi:hypothetical protein